MDQKTKARPFVKLFEVVPWLCDAPSMFCFDAKLLVASSNLLFWEHRELCSPQHIITFKEQKYYVRFFMNGQVLALADHAFPKRAIESFMLGLAGPELGRALA